jgi:hypothetical protein
MNNMIRSIVITTGSLSTLAGRTTSGSTNGVGTNAALPFPLFASSFDRKILLSEEDQNGIRKIKNKLPELQDADEENRNEVRSIVC